ncbi:DUF3558 domain-containing protein [Nocardia vermiculata]|uniref:DUF3558 domain-containing protein n=1 Tax=Nocardia vermiculata TaxID=257274 RepID=A0A846XPE7_9NOCA|nr:DUF3558 domain-containing protein [Nocardia vermiculata]NKY48913.1 DUF3558 domain-containing protein [Nocardia vermiculata]
MSSWGKLVRGAVLAAGAVVLVAGCSSGDAEPEASGPTSTSPTIAPEAPTAFDGCKLPESVMQSEGFLDRSTPTDQKGADGIRWTGCLWVVSNGYSANFATTNITVDMVRANKKWAVYQELTVDGRPALTYHDAAKTDMTTDCMMNVEMKGGSMEISIDNPPSGSKTGDTPACDVATRLAEQLVPTIPADA